MSKRLEDFIKTNRAEFDDIEPGVELWNNIEQKLFPKEAIPAKREAKTFTLAFVLRAVAIVMVVMAVGFMFYLKISRPAVNLAAINPEYAKQQMHYASLVKNKRSELKALAQSDPQLYKEFSSEIAKMDSTYKKLNNDLVTSPNQDLVLRAMIRNLQIQTEVLNQQLQVIEQFNQMKKEQQHESKNI
jgi:hypothetical protein